MCKKIKKLKLLTSVVTHRYDAIRAPRSPDVPGTQRVQRGLDHAGEAKRQAAGAYPVPARGRAHTLARRPAEPRGDHRTNRTAVRGATEREPRLFVETPRSI